MIDQEGNLTKGVKSQVITLEVGTLLAQTESASFVCLCLLRRLPILATTVSTELLQCACGQRQRRI